LAIVYSPTHPVAGWDNRGLGGARPRIVIDAVPLLIRSAGVKNYLFHWIAHLRRAAGEDAIGTFPALDGLGELNHDASVAGRGRTVWGLAALAVANYSPVPVLDWVSRGAAIFHATNLIRRPPRRTRLTATVHDLTSLLMPELHPRANLRADRSFVELARAADRLIAVSAHTRDDAVKVLGVSEEKITVIHSGVPDAFFDPHAAAVQRVRERYGLRRPFVLFVGTIEPRKNLDVLMSAYQELPASTREAFELVIAGPSGWAAAETKARLRTARYLGYVPEPDLAPLTAGATVFAYPSLYEGFGFPVAQAMAAGVPVITSNTSSLPEIAGGAAALVDPRSQAELRNALGRLLDSPEQRAKMAAAGRLRAREFRWEKCAARSLEFFESVSGQRITSR
jgi:alpha-1,3-rhamnosyl/mannosyltransferase